jgi:hypothetical protein
MTGNTEKKRQELVQGFAKENYRILSGQVITMTVFLNFLL